MDVEKPMRKMLKDEDVDTAIYILDSAPRNKRFTGPVGKETTKVRLVR